MKHLLTIIVFLLLNRASAQCDSASTYFEEIPDNVTILVGDSCFKNNDINVLDSIIIKNELDYESALGLCLLYTSPSPRDKRQSRMPASA